jgi:hypothetical protein
MYVQLKVLEFILQLHLELCNCFAVEPHVVTAFNHSLHAFTPLPPATLFIPSITLVF